jgi:predicted ATPase/class 3 adenylate cyclase
MRPLPSGNVTLLFSDIEGSTRLLQQLGAETYAVALAEHRRIMREAFTAHGGAEVDTQGDAFFVAFPQAEGALAAAAEAQTALASGPIRVRMGIHSGEPLVTAEGYVGIDVHRAARVMSAAHGGQVLVSQPTYLLLDDTRRLTELGRHRLKDLTEAQPLYQLGTDEFPPLRTLYRTNLPVQPTPLVGRDKELGEVLEFLTSSRLVTLTGAGGSGKTRLALQAAAELVNDYKDGVWWVSLAAVRDPDLVEPTIAQVVGSRNGLVEHLRSRQTLLLLDNFEQLIEAAPTVSALLSEAPNVQVLTTSRERLAVAGEQEYPVPTLVPTEAIALFTARARQLKPSFQPDGHVQAICRRLDGLPLAVELCAARVKVLTPAQILDRLGRSLDLLTGGARDAPERHRTLRATIEWSYQLLNADERRLFARLAVFAGSFDLEAAEQISETDLNVLTALVDKSLLRQTEKGRFFMLETVQAYATERLEQSGAPEIIRRRHAAHFLEIAELADAALQGPEQAQWLDRLEQERGNLRAALDWAVSAENDEMELRLATALRHFWEARGPVAEALRRLEGAVQRAGDRLPERRLDALRAAALSALTIGDHEAAARLARQLLQLGRALGDYESQISALIKLGAAASELGEFDQARSLMEQAVAIARGAGEARFLGHALLNLGGLMLDEGDAERAAELCELSLSEGGAALDARGKAVALLNLSIARRRLGGTSQARQRARQALELSLAQGDRSLMAHALGAFAAAAASDDAELAAKLLGGGAALTEELGLAADRESVEAVLAAADDETYRVAYAQGRALSVDEAVQLAFADDS